MTSLIASAPAYAEQVSVTDIYSPMTAVPTVIERGLQSGPVVFTVLAILIMMSILTWAILFAKWKYLRKIRRVNDKFLTKFKDSRSLSELNSQIDEQPYSPLREVFRSGYGELLRNRHLREHKVPELGISAAMDNLKRTLQKTKIEERRQLERFLTFLAISASSSPFIGLFGTVWGIMSAFEGIAQTGSTSLATVAPGISEALIATAFGLAAAIPAVIGYNIANQNIRGLLIGIDGFSADFLNIIERYFVADKTKKAGPSELTHSQED
ncbi:MAG: MotA/TolQ/ExbB proton channel family protein [Deltaproteobacteria bacterium]|nr:MotA/TolQ/ExbB proton channel family protein [Deltaproteobacteria bacterium]